MLSDQLRLLAESDPNALARLVDQVLEPTFVVDAQGLVVFANSEAEKITGRTLSELLDDHPPFSPTAMRLTLARPDGQSVEVRVRRHNFEWRGAPATAVSLTVVDDNEQMQSLSQELERANQRAREADERFRRYYLQAPPEVERLIVAEDRANEALARGEEARRAQREAEERAERAEADAADARSQVSKANLEAQQANERFRLLYERSGPAVAEREQLEEELQRLRNELTELRRELAHSKEQLAARQVELEDSLARGASLQSRVAEYESQLANQISETELNAARNQVAQLQSQLLAFREQIQTLQTNESKAWEQIGQLRSQLTQTQESARNQITQAHAQAEAQLEQFRAELRSARDQNERLRQAEAEWRQKLAQLQNQMALAPSQSDLDSALERLTNLSSELVELRHQSAQQAELESELRNELEHYRQQLSAIDPEETESLRQHIAQLEQRLAEPAPEAAALAQAQERIASLEHELRGAFEFQEEGRRRLAEVEPQLLAITGLEEELARARAHISELEHRPPEVDEQSAEELAAANAYIQQLEDRLGSMTELEQEYYQLREHVVVLESRPTETAEPGRLESLERQVASLPALEEELFQARQQLAWLESQPSPTADPARLEQLEQQLASLPALQEELYQTRQQLAWLESQPAQSQAGPDPFELEAELAAARTRINELEMAGGASADPLLQERLEMLEVQLQSLEEENEEIPELQHRIRELERINQELQASGPGSSESSDRLEFEELRSQLASVRAERAELRDQLEALQGGAGETAGTPTGRHDQRVEELEQELRLREIDLREANEKLAKMRSQALSAETASLDADQQRDALESRLREMSSEHQQELAALRSRLDGEADRLREQLIAAEREAEARRSQAEQASLFEAKMLEFEQLARHGEARLQEMAQALAEAKKSSAGATDHETARLAFEDTLTSLPNINILNRYLDMTTKRVATNEGSLAVLVVDIDRFRVANDTMGHKAGDELLRQVGQRLNSLVERPDVLGRRGEDEFLIVIFVEAPENPNQRVTGGHTAAANKARGLAGKLMTALRQPFVIEGQSIHLTASIGISLYPGDSASAEDLIEHADSAMYSAKDAGRARTQFYTFDIHQNQEAKLRLISELHQGIARNEFMLYYQPIVDLNKGRIEGLEALLRWNHPMRGLLEPAEFLEAAEDSALIITIGDWVIDEACRLISQFRGKTFVSVNLSPRQLVQSNFARRFMKAIEKARIRADRVVVEVNEAAGCLENAQIHEVLNQLAQWQVGIGIDDFGTGSSSLQRLKETNIRFLKVANQWVAGVPHDPHCTAIARGAIGLAAGLGTFSLAEGVETKEQLRGLKQFGCTLAQGFFFSEPVPTQAVPALMKRSWKF